MRRPPAKPARLSIANSLQCAKQRSATNRRSTEPRKRAAPARSDWQSRRRRARRCRRRAQAAVSGHRVKRVFGIGGCVVWGGDRRFPRPPLSFPTNHHSQQTRCPPTDGHIFALQYHQRENAMRRGYQTTRERRGHQTTHERRACRHSERTLFKVHAEDGHHPPNKPMLYRKTSGVAGPTVNITTPQTVNIWSVSIFRQGHMASPCRKCIYSKHLCLKRYFSKLVPPLQALVFI